jgi:hypothetical protein
VDDKRAGSNVGIHNSMLRAHIFACIDDASNVRIAKRYMHARMHDEWTRCCVGMHDRRARI